MRKARGNVSDVNNDAGVFLYRDSSIAPLLDTRRMFKAVWGVLARMVQLESWFQSWVPDSVFSAGGGRGSVEAWVYLCS